MFKFIIIACIALWLLGILSGGRYTLFKSSGHLVRWLIMLAIGFTGVAFLDRFPIMHSNLLLRGAAVASIIAAAWILSGFIASRISDR